MDSAFLRCGGMPGCAGELRGTFRRAAQDAPGELVGEVPLVVDRSALVGDRVRRERREAAGLDEQRLAGALTAEQAR
ncbi:hypothetical protein [Cryobacterium breve]|uniref:hypothetical protein n=1 Tax=Cryobacterium breve TaxID=1259258 RepID=UPI00248C586E|nr:hypothetical protein [Cryobacterium breve]